VLAHTPLAELRPSWAEFVEGWGESDVDEVVSYLQQAYTQRKEAKAMGTAAAAFMRGRFSWTAAIDRIASHIQQVHARSVSAAAEHEET
jgi:hypothetical protein